MSPRQVINTVPEELHRKEILRELYLVESGSCTDVQLWNIPMSTKSELRIYFLASGKGTICVANKAHIVQQNDIVFQTHQNQVNWTVSSAIPMELWWIDLRGPALPALTKKLSISDASPVINGVYDPRFLQELKNVVTHYDALSSADFLHITSSLFKIIAILIDSSSNSQWISVMYDNSSILYTGEWKAWPSRFEGAQEEYYTAIPKAYAEYNFIGTGIKWYGTVNFDCGKADVIIDGNHVTTVDTYSPVRLTKQLLYINSRLTYGHHIIKIFCTGNKNDKATNCDIVIESFQFLSIAASPEQEDRIAAPSQIIGKAIDLLHANYSTLSIEKLAQILGVNRSYLSTKFSQEMGISPSQYLNQIKLEKAKKLLVETDLPVSRIAADLGYTDVFYFSKSFKAFENVTPSQYRKLSAK